MSDFRLTHTETEVTRGETQETIHSQTVTYNSQTDTQTEALGANKVVTQERSQSGTRVKTNKADGPPSILLTFDFELSALGLP